MNILQHLVTLELRQLLGMSTSRAAATARGKGATGQVLKQKHSGLQQQQQRLGLYMGSHKADRIIAELLWKPSIEHHDA